MGNTLEEFNRRAELTKDLHAAPTELTNSAGQQTGIRLQLPSLFDAAAVAMNDNSQGVEPARLYPPAGKPLGYSFAYEKMTGSEGSQVPVYGYFALINANRYPEAEVQTTLQEQLGVGGWQPLELDTPSGGKLECRFASVSGQQAFGGQTIDGQLDVYLVPGQQDHVVVMWRAPSSQKEFFSAGRASVGSLTGLGGGGGGEAATEPAEGAEPAADSAESSGDESAAP